MPVTELLPLYRISALTKAANGMYLSTVMELIFHKQGAVIRTVFDGEVSKVFSFPGSNTCMIVRHGEYYTFYANIIDPP